MKQAQPHVIGSQIVQQNPLSLGRHDCFEVMLLEVKLLVDDAEIALNEFVAKMLGGTLAGAISSLRGIKKDWKKIDVSLTK